MKYLIVGIAVLLAGECALAQTPAPAEPVKKSAVTQPAPAAGMAAAKKVGTKDRTVESAAYLKTQEKKRAAMAKKQAAKGADASPGAHSKSGAKSVAEDGVRPGSLMTEEERTAHRKTLQSFKTLDECQKYQQDYQAKVEARAKEQNKKLRPFNEAACNRYKVAADKAAPAAAKPATK